MTSLFVVLSSAGRHRDLSKETREQAWWDQHAEFIDALVTEGFIALGGPFPDESGAMIVVRAASEAEVRARLAADPWYTHEILHLDAIHRWELYIDQLHPSS